MKRQFTLTREAFSPQILKEMPTVEADRFIFFGILTLLFDIRDVLTDTELSIQLLEAAE